MIDLELPVFDVPPVRPPRVPPDIYWDWVMDNIARLRESGQLDRIRKQRSREPVKVPFVLE